MSFDLNKAAPAWLAMEPGLPDILEAVNALQPDQWHERLAEALDFAYRVRFARVLMNHPSTGEMEALALHLEDVADDPGRGKTLDALAIPYASRWRMLRNVLEDRLAVRELPVPEMVKQRPQIQCVLEALHNAAGGRLSQETVESLLQPPGANRAHIFGLLEGWELVVRDKMATEQWFFLGPRAGEVISLAELSAGQRIVQTIKNSLPSHPPGTRPGGIRVGIPGATQQHVELIVGPR